MRYQDQRDFHRMAINAAATVIYVDKDEMRKVKGICRDLSATGLSLEVEQPIAVGESIEVLIEGVNVKPLDAKAEILRVDKADNGQMILGCKITSLA